MQGQEIDRTKFDDRSWICWCGECGCRFEATRSDASFCSPRCRVAFSRRPLKLANAIKVLDAFCIVVTDYSTRYRHNRLVFEAILNLEKRLKAAISSFEMD